MEKFGNNWTKPLNLSSISVTQVIGLVKMFRMLRIIVKKYNIKSNWCYRPLQIMTTLNPAQATLVLKLPPYNDHLSTTTSDQINLATTEIQTFLQLPLLLILTNYWMKINIHKAFLDIKKIN